jgi:hypothetical protein
VCISAAVTALARAFPVVAGDRAADEQSSGFRANPRFYLRNARIPEPRDARKLTPSLVEALYRAKLDTWPADQVFSG